MNNISQEATSDETRVTNVTPEQFNEFLKQAREIKRGWVDKNRDWFSARQLAPFFYFRASGILTIILGAALPAIAPISEDIFRFKTITLSAMSVAIAILAGLSTFFRWERTWKGRNQTKAAIDNLTAQWDLEIARATATQDLNKSLEIAYAATNALLTGFGRLNLEEGQEFFDSLQFPQTSTTKKNI